METTFNWGIIGPGRIAGKFADAVKVCPGARVFAVASRSAARADAFADRFGIECRYDNYEDLAADPRIDAVYIATTHPRHLDCVRICLNQCKAVVCEKPMTMNTWQTEQLISLARSKNAFLMEALWSRFLPVYRQVAGWIADGRIGDVQVLRAEFGFAMPWQDADRHVDPANGGGALLDVGVYNVALAVSLLGRDPSEISSQAALYRTGVDEKSSILLRYAGGAMAVLTGALTAQLPGEALISGTRGSIRIPQHWRAESAELILPEGQQSETVEAGYEGGNGYQYEIMDVMARVRAGEKESPLMPLADSLAISRIMTVARGQWGLVYPDCEGEEL